MMRVADTIYALSSGSLPAAVAVVRISGPKTRFVIETICGQLPKPRQAAYLPIRDREELVDRGLVLFFEGPKSFTGEDLAEFQLHGSRAVVAALLACLSRLEGLRPAEAGEFTRRAFENGRMDLTAVEGLGDLIAAETNEQRRQALRLADGAFARLAERWRGQILEARAFIEADLDFSDEEDVPGSVAGRAFELATATAHEIGRMLNDGHRGERVRDGFQVALMGPPNAGKSSLLNALAGRDVAIVTAVPGTTRDIVSVPIDLNGYAVVITDTAGLRETEDVVEQEGIRRARREGRRSDLILWLDEAGTPAPEEVQAFGVDVIALQSKCDDAEDDGEGYPRRISAVTGRGLPALLNALAKRVAAMGPAENSLIARERHRHFLERAAEALKRLDRRLPLEVNAEYLRDAAEALGRLTGRMDVEEILGAIFSSFCIGK